MVDECASNDRRDERRQCAQNVTDLVAQVGLLTGKAEEAINTLKDTSTRLIDKVDAVVVETVKNTGKVDTLYKVWYIIGVIGVTLGGWIAAAQAWW
jgi:hypothetical protein